MRKLLYFKKFVFSHNITSLYKKYRNKISQHTEKIIIEEQYRKKYYKLLEKILQSNFLSEGPINILFARKFAELSNLYTTTISGGGPALLALLKYVNVLGKDVIIPANSCISVPLTVKLAGGNVILADCKKNDLCIGISELEASCTKNTKAVIVIHIGGHLAFDIFEIKKFCKKRNIFLIEDCCHADGASFKGISAGGFGIGGAFSFHASKMLPLGEGGMVVSKFKDVINFVDRFKNYGSNVYNSNKKWHFSNGFNFSMSEITAALGIVQLERLPNILKWKRILAAKYNKIFRKKILFPPGMKTNYYKFIIFDTELKEEVGKVYETPIHKLMGLKSNFPNSEWISKHHSCVPIFYGYEKANWGIKKLSNALIKKRR